MLSLKQPLDDTIEVEGKTYSLDLSYDNVLRWYDLVEDETVTDVGKIEFAFRMFVLDCPEVEDISDETKIATIQSIANYLSGKTDHDEEEESHADDTYESNKQHLSFEEDAGYIFASFHQEYGIDLIDLQGKLRWEKFIALLNGMRDNTKLNQIIGIRAADLPSGSDEGSKAERERLIKLKAIYELKSNVSIVEQEMDSIFATLVDSATKKGG